MFFSAPQSGISHLAGLKKRYADDQPPKRQRGPIFGMIGTQPFGAGNRFDRSAIASAIHADCCRVIFNPKYRTTGTLKVIAFFEHRLFLKIRSDIPLRGTENNMADKRAVIL
jgi:hypothetical protein